jgi:hypothetical protein
MGIVVLIFVIKYELGEEHNVWPFVRTLHNPLNDLAATAQVKMFFKHTRNG